jgi:hypothetical protein
MASDFLDNVIPAFDQHIWRQRLNQFCGRIL